MSEHATERAREREGESESEREIEGEPASPGEIFLGPNASEIIGV